jgi:hypothetical protein
VQSQAHQSKRLKNIDVQKAVEKGESDIVMKAMQPLLDKLGEKATMTELPEAITADIVLSKRLGKLLESASSNPLDALIETKFYESLGFMNENQVSTAWSAILGDEDFEKLSNGSEEEKLAVVEKFVASD